MKHNLRKLVAWLVIVAALVGCSGKSDEKGLAPDASPGAVPEIAGEYVVNGIDPLGTEYSGRLKIQPGGAPGKYLLTWIITGSIQEGEGTLQGNQLNATWRIIQGMNRQSNGSAVYTVTQKGQLHGFRLVENYETSGTEEAFPAEDTP